MQRALAVAEADMGEDGDEAETPEAPATPPPATPPGAPGTPAVPATAAPPTMQTGPDWERFLEQERHVQQQRQNVTATAAALETQRAQWERERSGLELIRSGDIAGGLAALGTSYADLTAQVIAGKGAKKPAPGQPAAPVPPALPPEVQQDLADLKAWKQQQAEEQAWNQVRTSIQTIVTADTSERFELLRAEPDYQHRVYAEADRAWRAAGMPDVPPLTWEQAADRVEASLIEEVKRRGATKKARTLLGTGEPPASQPAQHATPGTPPASPPSPAAKRAPTRSLGNGMSSEVTRSSAPQTREERLRRATAIAEQMDRDKES